MRSEEHTSELQSLPPRRSSDLPNGAISISNWLPSVRTIRYVPCIIPVGVLSGHHDEYLNDSPGARTGCSPTTPGPLTSSTWSSPSVMVQWRLSNCTVSAPRFVMRTVYSNIHSSWNGCECSGEYLASTSTRIWLVTASDMGLRSGRRSDIFGLPMIPIVGRPILAGAGFQAALEFLPSSSRSE